MPTAGLYRMAYTITHRGGGAARGVVVVKSQRRWIAGRPLIYQVKLGGSGKTTISNLPAGLTFSPASGAIQGVPRLPGVYSNITATQVGVNEIETFDLVVDSDPTAKSSSGSMSEASTKRRGAGWNYPAIFCMGPAAPQQLGRSGQIRNFPAASIRGYALTWTNVEGWKWNDPMAGMSSRLLDPEVSLRKSQKAGIQRAFPGALRLARISYESGMPGSYLPTNHIFWLRDANGNVSPSMESPGEWRIDFSQPEFLQRLAERVRFLVESGCVDGVYLPDWSEKAFWPSDSRPEKGVPGESQEVARVELLRALRQAVGLRGWLMAEATGSSWALTGPLLDGVHLVASTEAPPVWPPAEAWWPDPYAYREKGSSSTLWERIAQSLKSFGQSGVLKRPGMVALEMWARHDWTDGRTKDPRMAGLAMSLCLSDGAFLYARPDWWQDRGRSVVPGEHLWLPEWSVFLGKPLETRRMQPEDKGFYRRKFEHGWSVYVPPEIVSPVEIEFAEEVESVATGKRALVHNVLSGSGDLFLKTE